MKTVRPFRIDAEALSSFLPSRAIRGWQGLLLLGIFLASLAAAQAQGVAAPQTPSAIATLIEWMPFILKGFVLNLVMSFLAMGIATVLGIALGMLQLSHSRLLRAPAWIITHLFRNSPWLVILFVVMLLVPFEVELPGGRNLILSDWIKATIAFSLPVMANVSEIVRGAIVSIPRGQWESAESLAFTRGQTLRWIILPQCVKRAIPPWMNWYALLAMATPMASILGVREAVGNAQAAMEAAGARPELLVPFYLFLLLLFFAYIYPISIWTRAIERKYAVET
ncbi:amino acid ABC transporter permease [Afifella marina]|uniref:Polar amino acid transport system permease protein n=1 Tax=Afifella marina DSM 2698 TaxID=1120955 RepID=A0A1G5M9G5_AFIMA|nr:ABC transporter permease subunit [Afifella marina]MBK1622860.1 polar amino acid ABC transporter permease [Afifella marina DSM 2698]MBK1625855.1 polar amino acid ABC transporter permease [Afifella marina]MBK5917677.1 polar amino acid ABC transporter permease [Afifella marina]RAI23600.1 polar amino acid ABC transporter permease [Afifella marina DSM 2698]SCZ21178.1 polar amino acid transport system permease protein [Afifella marina DSM 2698]